MKPKVLLRLTMVISVLIPACSKSVDIQDTFREIDTRGCVLHPDSYIVTTNLGNLDKQIIGRINPDSRPGSEYQVLVDPFVSSYPDKCTCPNLRPEAKGVEVQANQRQSQIHEETGL
jgi:hypothetical protein